VSRRLTRGAASALSRLLRWMMVITKHAQRTRKAEELGIAATAG
jgi:hypothetical protein